MSYYHRGILVSQLDDFNRRASAPRPSLYRRGVIVGAKGAGVLDKMVPGRVLREMRLVDSDIVGADRELLAAPQMAEFYKGAWSNFYEKWKKFYKDNSDWGPRFMSGPAIYDRTQEFRDELLEYRAIAEEQGMVWGGPAPIEGRKDDYLPDVAKDWVAFVKTIFWVTLAFAGGAILLYLFKGGAVPALPGGVK